MKPDSEPLFTDAPRLHSNFLIGSVQLVFWLFVHPSAWRYHLERLDTGLPIHFCLSDLTRRHWFNWTVWRFLFMSYLVWPLLMGGLIASLLGLLRAPVEAVVTGVILGVTVGLIASLTVSIVASLPVGVAVGSAVGLVVGFGGSLTLGNEMLLAAQMADVPFDLAASTVIGVAGGLAGSMSFAVAAGISGAATNMGQFYSLTRQMSGVVVGCLIGLGFGLLVTTVQGQLATGLTIGVPFGLALFWRAGRWIYSLTGGAIVGLAGSLAGMLVNVTTTPSPWTLLALLALLTALFALPYVLAERIAGTAAGALAGALGGAGGLFMLVASPQSIMPLIVFSILGLLLGLVLAWWRPVVLYPLTAAWNKLLLQLDEQRLPAGRSSLLHWHSAFWDEFQRLPLLGLDTHLLLVLEQQPEIGAAALDYLATSRQRWAAQAAQIELDARYMTRCQNVADLGRVHHDVAAGELAGPASALLRSFSRISRDLEAAMRQESIYNRRLALGAAEERLDGLLRELTRSNDQYAVRFRPIAARWRRLVAGQKQQLAAEAELRQEIDSPYIIGVPLTDQQEIFVGRTDISSRIEQLLVDRRQPPLLLYGQRRVGKTSLLNNLGRLLPTTVVPLFIDLQGPASRAQDDVGFLYNIGRSMIRSARRQRLLVIPSLNRTELQEDPFTHFDEWLDELEVALGDQLALLMLDEFEVLATALQNGRFDENTILGMLRHLIQHRPRFKVLFAGSHTLDEFQRWSSYLINVQLIHIGYLSQAETRQLVEQPVQDFALRYEAAAGRRVWELTAGHPFLVQLLCAEVVALKNEQDPAVRRLATVADVETAVPAALSHGSFFFADIEQNQVDGVGREILRLLAQAAEGNMVPRQTLVDYIPSLLSLEESLAHLQRRELITAVDGGYRFRVELVRRWFAGKG
jgi:hypothetical protein